MAKRLAKITRNEPAWCTPAGLGYGQCYITESALLLDRMDDAEHMLDWLGVTREEIEAGTQAEA